MSSHPNDIFNCARCKQQLSQWAAPRILYCSGCDKQVNTHYECESIDKWYCNKCLPVIKVHKY